jgi:cell division protein FtsW
MADFLSRTDRSIIGKWWWTIDKPLLLCFITLLITGVFLSFAASPVVADRISLDSYFFVKRHAFMAMTAFVIMIIFSILKTKNIRLLSWAIFSICFIFLILTPLLGTEIKGARRWISILGFSLQSSELIKPVFVVITAWILSQPIEVTKINQIILSGILWLSVIGLILLQPDFGMTFIISAAWFLQIFLAGLPLLWVWVVSLSGLIGSVSAYFLLPHVKSRINRFLDPSSGDQYQITQSLEAFRSGGFWGQGPGEGMVKRYLPDAHSDFVFSVAAEEFGFIVCFIIISIYTFICVRGTILARKEHVKFLMLAILGLIYQFSLQSLVNIGSSIKLIPTKGMTLPFLSYGGSSLIGIAICAGIILNMTRKRVDDRGVI